MGYHADALLAAAENLGDDALNDFLDGLAGSQRVEDLGWRVRERHISTERFQQRNDEIVRLRRRGLSLGQIADELGMSRDGVKQVLRRRRQKSGYGITAYPPPYVYDGNRRTLRA